MANYYGYKERDLDKSIIDWAGITKTISDDILTEKTRRDELKFTLEKTQQEQLNKLNDYEQGLDKSANMFAMQEAQNHRDFLMENHRLMKSGLISVNDSKITKQNVSDTWTNINGALKGHQEAYKKLTEAGGLGNLALAEDMSQMLDFKDKKIYLSAKGEGFFAKVDPKTGEMDMKSLQPVKSVLNTQLQQWDTIDVQESVVKDAAGADQWVISPTSTKTVDDVRNNPAYKVWKENKIKAALTTDRISSSVLMDYLNYDYTTDESEADADTILMVRDNNGVLQPKLTEEQTKKAKEAYGNALEMALGHKTTKQYVAPRTTPAATIGANESADSLYDLSTRLAQGDSVAISQLKNQLYKKQVDGKTVEVQIDDVKYTDKAIVFLDANGRTLTKVNRTGDIQKDALQVASVIESGSSADNVQSLFDKGSTRAKGKLPALRGEATTPIETTNAIDYMPVDETEAKEYLDAALSDYNIEVAEAFIGKDMIRLKNTHTGEESKNFNTTDLVGIKNWLKQYNIEPSTAKRVDEIDTTEIDTTGY